MIEIAGIRLPVARLSGDAAGELRAATAAAARRLHVDKANIASIDLRRRSIDARKRENVVVSVTVRLRLRGDANAERAALRRLRTRGNDRGIRMVDDTPVSRGAAGVGTGDGPLAGPPRVAPDRRVIVVGAGCAGLFASLALARAGLAPLLVERGDDVTRRTAAIDAFNATGALDAESNIQFGMGGAGTFSDGKLATGTKSPHHRGILHELVAAGAPRAILWDAHPHIGSDVLPTVVANLAAAVRAAGGEVRTRTTMVDLHVSGGRVTGVTLATRDANGATRTERVAARAVVLATGHSARGVFRLLQACGVPLERKPFAVGLRIEHAQDAIDRAQYGSHAGHPALGAAPYKLSCHVGADDDRRGVFTFCMCPGGSVVAAASEPGGVVTNGMSLSGRNGTNANAGLLVDVRVGDLAAAAASGLRMGDGTVVDLHAHACPDGHAKARAFSDDDDVLAGVWLQRACERAAFEAGGGCFVAPAQLVGDFLRGVPSTGVGDVAPTYPRGVAWGALDACLPAFVVDALRAGIPRLARRLRGFDVADAVLTGVETRSSSPVRVVRGANGQSVGTAGLFPCGEGAGYAGGIMSAAADGLRAAAWAADMLAASE